MRPRAIASALTATLVMVALTAPLSGCLTPEGAAERENQKAAAAVESVPAATVDPSSDTAGDIKVAWTAAGGSARQDPLGLLSDTPLEKSGNHLRAQRTVKFTPNAPESTSAEGKYMYVMDLVRSGESDLWSGTMRIDWTMTIVRTGSKSDYHAVYSGKASATCDASGKVTGGRAMGTAMTTDTFTAGESKMKPKTSTDQFDWTFASK